MRNVIFFCSAIFTLYLCRLLWPRKPWLVRSFWMTSQQKHKLQQKRKNSLQRKRLRSKNKTKYDFSVRLMWCACVVMWCAYVLFYGCGCERSTNIQSFIVTSSECTCSLAAFVYFEWIRHNWVYSRKRSSALFEKSYVIRRWSLLRKKKRRTRSPKRCQRSKLQDLLCKIWTSLTSLKSGKRDRAFLGVPVVYSKTPFPPFIMSSAFPPATKLLANVKIWIFAFADHSPNHRSLCKPSVSASWWWRDTARYPGRLRKPWCLKETSWKVCRTWTWMRLGQTRSPFANYVSCSLWNRRQQKADVWLF